MKELNNFQNVNGVITFLPLCYEKQQPEAMQTIHFIVNILKNEPILASFTQFLVSKFPNNMNVCQFFYESQPQLTEQQLDTAAGLPFLVQKLQANKEYFALLLIKKNIAVAKEALNVLNEE